MEELLQVLNKYVYINTQKNLSLVDSNLTNKDYEILVKYLRVKTRNYRDYFIREKK